MRWVWAVLWGCCDSEGPLEDTCDSTAPWAPMAFWASTSHRFGDGNGSLSSEALWKHRLVLVLVEEAHFGETRARFVRCQPKDLWVVRAAADR